MGLLYKIAKWSVNRLIKKGVDLTDLVETDNVTKNIRKVINSLNDELLVLQDEFSLKRIEIIDLQSDLIQTLEPTIMGFLAETDDHIVKTTMTKIWFDKTAKINEVIEDHEGIIAKFANKHEQLEKLENKLR
jgi:uncharacterized protein (UPF0147 family)